MKTKLRKLTIDGTQYLWTLYRPNGDGDGGIGLRVFLGKENVIDEWVTGVDKPDAITPRFVEVRIRQRDRILDVLEKGPLLVDEALGSGAQL